MKLFKKLKTVPTILVTFILLNFLNIMDSQRAKPEQSVYLLTTSKGTCSAFVISNTQAITAGHCINEYTMEQIEFGRRSVLDKIMIYDIQRMLSLVFCSQNKDCIDDINSTYDHMINEQRNILNVISRAKPEVLTLHKNNLKVEATAYRKRLDEQDGDYAVLVGDFRAFRKVKMNTLVELGSNNISIGYVFGKLVKTNNMIVGKMKNFIETEGHLIRGMSGGALFNSEGEVIGINSMYSEDRSYYTHIGLIDLTEF